MIETDGLQTLIDDAKHVRLPTPRHLLDLREPKAPAEIRIPDALVTELEDYELYVG